LKPGFAFRKERRLRKRAEFVRGQSEGRRVSTAHFTLLVARSPRVDAASRLGVVVTRKIGGAVTRNRIKRLCRECFRSWPELLPNGIDLIVIAKSGAGALGLAEVRLEWERVASILKKRALEVLAQSPGDGHLTGRRPPPNPS
jgi:ribonuclease P protein component